MKRYTKIISCLTSFVLAFSLVGIPSYAFSVESDTSHEFDAINDIQVVEEYDSAGEIASTVGSQVAESTALSDDPAGEDDALPPVDARIDVSAVDNEESSIPSDAASLAAADEIDFVYVDATLVAIGEQQNIAIGLSDLNAVLEDATLQVVCADTKKAMDVPAAVAIEGAVLFTMAFEVQADAGAYNIVSLTYSLDGAKYCIPLVANDNAYMFDVVTADVAASVRKGDQISVEEGVSAYTISDDGSLVAAESVEEAINIADSEGVSNVDAGESVIDDKAVADGALDNPDYDAYSSVDADNENEAPTVISDTLNAVLGIEEAHAASVDSRENYLIVALDPGHGGSDAGAGGYGLYEKYVNLTIAQYCYENLLTYTGVYPYLTRTTDEYVGLQERVNRATAIGADVFVCLHNNAANGSAHGAEVWVPNYSSYLYNETHVVGEQLGYNILNRITQLGLTNRGVKVRDCTNDATYPDGSLQDYYTVIAASREAGIPGIIVEHAFIDNYDDATKLASDSFLKALGQADAMGIAAQYSLVKDSTARSAATVQAVGHTSGIGWLTNVYDCKVIGTTGKSRGLEAFQASLLNDVAASGGLTYRAYVGSSWQDWVSDGATAGTTGQGIALQAIQMKLTGAAADSYDVYYRVHVANIGWLGWAKNGASAGSIGYNYNAEAIEIAVVEKGAQAPGDTSTPFTQKDIQSGWSSVIYQAHVANVGTQHAVSDGATAGTSGQGNAIEALRIKLDGNLGGSIEYNVHCANLGWQGWRSGNAWGGTTGESRQTESIQIRLTGDVAQKYDVYYRVHAQDCGWLDWAKNGEVAGTLGYGLRMEAIQIRLVEKGSAAPGGTAAPNRKNLVGYYAHVSNVGWQSAVGNGAVAGTTGEAQAIEAIAVYLPCQMYSGSLRYNAHVAQIGWQGWRSAGTVAGTTGQALAVEALKIELTGEMASHYDVYYRAHSADFGWLDWAKNGEVAGTVGYGKQMEALQVVLVEKGGAAPGSTANPSSEGGNTTVSYAPPAATVSSIMGASQATAAQMAAYYRSTGREYPSWVYAAKGAATIDDYCRIVVEEAQAEGVRAEVLFCQAMYETGWLQFGGSVQPDQCNFGGLGATGPTVGGATFPDVRTGLRAQTQHLKAYASTDALNNPCVDPRFNLVSRGIAPNLEDLNGRWAVPGNGYGERILAMTQTLLTY